MTKQSRKRTAEAVLGQLYEFVDVVKWADVSGRAVFVQSKYRHAIEDTMRFLESIRDEPEPERKPNFGWPFDNVNEIILKSR